MQKNIKSNCDAKCNKNGSVMPSKLDVKNADKNENSIESNGDFQIKEALKKSIKELNELKPVDQAYYTNLRNHLKRLYHILQLRPTTNEDLFNVLAETEFSKVLSIHGSKISKCYKNLDKKKSNKDQFEIVYYYCRIFYLIISHNMSLYIKAEDFKYEILLDIDLQELIQSTQPESDSMIILNEIVIIKTIDMILKKKITEAGNCKELLQTIDSKINSKEIEKRKEFKTNLEILRSIVFLLSGIKAVNKKNDKQRLTDLTKCLFKRLTNSVTDKSQDTDVFQYKVDNRFGCLDTFILVEDLLLFLNQIHMFSNPKDNELEKLFFEFRDTFSNKPKFYISDMVYHFEEMIKKNLSD